MTALRLLGALVLLALATGAALLAADVRGWERTIGSDDAVFAAAPAAPTWRADPSVPFAAAERLLGLGDDLRARRAFQRFRATASLQVRLDNALEATAERARTEDALATVGRGHDALLAARADVLLGILAFGDLSRGGGTDQTQAEATFADFEGAVRADPSAEAAKYDLELVLRLLAANGVRPGATGGPGRRPAGKRGGAGTPGRGY